MLHPKLDQARISQNILNSYNNVKTLTRPAINQIEFEKSVSEDKIDFYLEDVIKGYIAKMISKLESEKDLIKKSELDNEIQDQLAPLVQIDVVFNNVTKSVWVDILDSDTKKYKVNSLTKKLKLVEEV